MQKVQSQSQDSLPPSTHITYHLQTHRILCLFCAHPRLQSLLVQQFIPFRVRVGFVRLVFNTHASHRIFLRFLLNLAPYAAVDDKLLHTLTLSRFQNTENHQMVLSDTFPNGKWNVEFSDFSSNNRQLEVHMWTPLLLGFLDPVHLPTIYFINLLRFDFSVPLFHAA